MATVLSIHSSECDYLVNGRYSCFLRDSTIVISNGTNEWIIGESQLTELEQALAEQLETINQIETELENKASINHTHSLSDITDYQEPDLSGYSLVGHTHSINDVSGLSNSLDGKASTSHTHSLSEITDYQAPDLSGYSLIGHGHSISQIDGLQTTLNNKAASIHSHSFDSVYKTIINEDETTTTKTLDEVLAELQLGTSPLIHTHSISDVNGLQTTLNGKSNVNHTHSFDNIYKSFVNQDQSITTKSLDEVLNEREASIRVLINGKANSTHTHEATEIAFNSDRTVKQELDRINSRMTKTNAQGVAFDLFDVIFGTAADAGLQYEVSQLQAGLATVQTQVAGLEALSGIYGVNNTTNGIMEVADDLADFSEVAGESRSWIDSLSEWFSSLRSHLTSQTARYVQLTNDYTAPALSNVSNASALADVDVSVFSGLVSL